MGLVRTFSLVLGATASITCSADDPAGWFEAWRAGRLGWFEAARAGEVTTLEVALQAGTSVDQTDEHGLTALMLYVVQHEDHLLVFRWSDIGCVVAVVVV